MSGVPNQENCARARTLPGFVIAGALLLGVHVASWGGAQGMPQEVAAHDRQLWELIGETAPLLDRFEPVSSGFLAPAAGVVSSSFGWRNISVAGNRYHGGIDIAVDRGTPVAASADGVVTHAGWAGAYGFAVYIEHADGFETRYAHLDGLLVEVGTFVRQGDVIGISGSSGAVTGPHVHFEIRVAGAAIDPFEFVDIRHRPR